MFAFVDQHGVLNERNEQMTAFAQYLIKVVSASVICGIINQIIRGKNSVAALIKMLSGIFVAVTVLSPVVNLKIDPDILSFDNHYLEGVSYCTDGERIASEKRFEYIKSSAQTYIVNKASSYGVELLVEIVVSEDGTNPFQSVVLTGDVSPYAKKQLSQLMTDDLGIPKEDQLWKN